MLQATSKARILVADDHKAMRSMLRSQLRELGYAHVDEAEDGAQTLKMIDATPPSVVLLDYYMPKMDGLGVLQCIKARQQTRSIVVVMMSGRADGALVQRSAQFGASQFLIKPFSPAQLREKLDLALRRAA